MSRALLNNRVVEVYYTDGHYEVYPPHVFMKLYCKQGLIGFAVVKSGLMGTERLYTAYAENTRKHMCPARPINERASAIIGRAVFGTVIIDSSLEEADAEYDELDRGEASYCGSD